MGVFYTCGCSPIEMLIANQLLRQVASEQAKTGRDEKRNRGNKDWCMKREQKAGAAVKTLIARHFLFASTSLCHISACIWCTVLNPQKENYCNKTGRGKESSRMAKGNSWLQPLFWNKLAKALLRMNKSKWSSNYAARLKLQTRKNIVVLIRHVWFVLASDISKFMLGRCIFSQLPSNTFLYSPSFCQKNEFMWMHSKMEESSWPWCACFFFFKGMKVTNLGNNAAGKKLQPSCIAFFLSLLMDRS